jgi:hypothetical protein
VEIQNQCSGGSEILKELLKQLLEELLILISLWASDEDTEICMLQALSQVQCQN